MTIANLGTSGYPLSKYRRRRLCPSVSRLTDAPLSTSLGSDPYFNKLICILATRCMTQAVYFYGGDLSPLEYLHYGLESPLYTHFTSPIRRYVGISKLPTIFQDKSQLTSSADTMITSKVGKRHALIGFEALKELFVQSLLPDRKLKTLLQQPLKLLPETKDGYSLLLFWYWEDCLKNRYDRFISALEEASRDMLPIPKDKALRTIYNLLKSKSEKEQRLLSALVNKMGDHENKSASNTDYHMSNLLSEHPNMKSVVISEVDSFLFRPRLNLQAKYHAVCPVTNK